MRKVQWMLAVILFLVSIVAQNVRATPDTGSDWEAKRERVRSLILLRLSDELNLNDTQTKQLGGILDKYHQQRKDLRQQIQALTTQLKNTLSSGKEPEIKKQIQGISTKKDEMDQIDNRMFVEIQGMLTVRQQAQYIIVMEDIRKQIWEMKKR